MALYPPGRSFACVPWILQEAEDDTGKGGCVQRSEALHFAWCKCQMSIVGLPHIIFSFMVLPGQLLDSHSTDIGFGETCYCETASRDLRKIVRGFHL